MSAWHTQARLLVLSIVGGTAAFLHAEPPAKRRKTVASFDVWPKPETTGPGWTVLCEMLQSHGSCLRATILEVNCHPVWAQLAFCNYCSADQQDDLICTRAAPHPLNTLCANIPIMCTRIDHDAC